jgi:hypothetical protein
VRWSLHARNATDTIRERWVVARWIIESVSTGWHNGKPIDHVQLFITTQRASRCYATLRTSPKALLRRLSAKLSARGAAHSTAAILLRDVGHAFKVWDRVVINIGPAAKD